MKILLSIAITALIFCQISADKLRVWKASNGIFTYTQISDKRMVQLRNGKDPLLFTFVEKKSNDIIYQRSFGTGSQFLRITDDRILLGYDKYLIKDLLFTGSWADDLKVWKANAGGSTAGITYSQSPGNKLIELNYGKPNNIFTFTEKASKSLIYQRPYVKGQTMFIRIFSDKILWGVDKYNIKNLLMFGKWRS